MTAAPSARGLFRATGNVAKANVVRDQHDFYPTPPEPTRAVLRAEQAYLTQFPLIWEPAAGDGAMLREIRRAGFPCIGSDLIDRGCGAQIQSFYDFDAPLSNAIITNPPFAECNWRDGKGRWIRHALETLGVDYMALLLSWNWPGAGGHHVWWRSHPPARVYLMRWKIDFTGGGAPPMLNGWFVWDKRHAGPTVLLMLDREDETRQSELFDGSSHV